MPRLSTGSVVSRIWEIYTDQTLVLVGTALILFGLEFLVILLIPSASIAIAILFWALSVLYQGMVVELVGDLQDGRRDHSIGGLLRSVEPVLLPLMAVSVLFGIGVAIGFVLLIIPGLILLVIWSVVAPVTVLERPGVFAAFGRSRELIRGNGRPVFGVIVVVGLTVIVVTLVITLATASFGSVGRALVLWFVDAAIAPVSALSASGDLFRTAPLALATERCRSPRLVRRSQRCRARTAPIRATASDRCAALVAKLSRTWPAPGLPKSRPRASAIRPRCRNASAGSSPSPSPVQSSHAR